MNSPMIVVRITIPGYYHVQSSENNQLVCVESHYRILIKYFLFSISNSIFENISLSVSNTYA